MNVNNFSNQVKNFYKKSNSMKEQFKNNNDYNNYQINIEKNDNDDEQLNRNTINFPNNNVNINSNIDFIQLGQMLKLKKNLENYINNYQGLNNNLNNNNNINFNMQYNNNNNNVNQFLYNNRNINNNINNMFNYPQANPNYNNIKNNQFLFANQERMYFNNNNNISYPNQNPQLYNNFYPYQKNLINNMNLNNYNNNIIYNYNHENDIFLNNNLNLEQVMSEMPTYELVEKCYIFSKYQSGCRFLQDYITENSNDSNLIKAFFEKILEHIRDLSKGQFSHYFVKKILLFINEFQLSKLIKVLSSSIEDISTNQYGTKVIQDLIDLIKNEKTFILLLNILTPYIKQLIIDLNGTQIVFKLITKYKNVKIIENIICTGIKDICVSKKGCNFLIKYFDFTPEESSINIKKHILLNLKDIITDQFGNYVIQNILLRKNSEIVKDFAEEIKNNIIFYSNNKFSSNAVETCFENDAIKNDVIKLFMVKDIFEKIIMDKFGNYVAQRAITSANENDRKILMGLLISLIPELKNKYFGEKLLSKMEFIYPNFFQNYN